MSLFRPGWLKDISTRSNAESAVPIPATHPINGGCQYALFGMTHGRHNGRTLAVTVLLLVLVEVCARLL